MLIIKNSTKFITIKCSDCNKKYIRQTRSATALLQKKFCVFSSILPVYSSPFYSLSMPQIRTKAWVWRIYCCWDLVWFRHVIEYFVCFCAFEWFLINFFLFLALLVTYSNCQVLIFLVFSELRVGTYLNFISFPFLVRTLSVYFIFLRVPH